MINEKIVALIREGYNLGFHWGKDKTIVSIARRTDDGLLLTNRFDLEEQYFNDGSILMTSIYNRVDHIIEMINVRENTNPDECQHQFVYIADGKYERKICCYCKGKFGYRVTQTVQIPLN